MLNNSLISLAVAGSCLTALSVLLNESQQRHIADWNVRVWATLDEFRCYLKAKSLFKLVLEDSPHVTALSTAGCFVVGLVGFGIFGFFFTLGLGALVGGILLNWDSGHLEPKIAFLLFLYAAIAATGLSGVWTSLKMWCLSIGSIIAAWVILPLTIVEFIVRRIAEHKKGPILTLSILVGAAFGLLKAIAP
jgi:hypothetical protein